MNLEAMNLERRVKRIALFLVLVGALPVVLASGAVFLFGLLVLSVVVSWTVVDRSNAALFNRKVLTLAALAAMGYGVYRWVGEESPALIALSDFFILIACVKCFDRKTTRDCGQLFVLSGLLMICGAILSGELAYPLAILVYLTVVTYGLMLFHMLREQEALRIRRRVSRQPAIPTPAHASRAVKAARRASLLAGAGTAAIALFIFFLFPRAGGNVFGHLRSSAGPTLTGFSPDAQFANLGYIQKSNQEVMRVKLTLNEDNIGRGNYQPYFRGLTFDKYLGVHSQRSPGKHAWEPAVWAESGSTKIRIGQIPRHLIQGYRPWDKEARIVQEYWFQPRYSNFLFAMYPATDIQAPEEKTLRRWTADHSIALVPRPTGTVHYRVSTPTIRSKALRDAIALERSDHGLSAPAAPKDIPVSAAVRELAARLRQNADNPDDPYEVALAIEAYLESDEFTYSLDNTGYDPQAEPIESFLFDRKRGHCEFFSAAMTILCQLNGIPARMVHGFHGGDFNEVGGYYLVRSSHAHSWVEIYIQTRDWVTFDPTPASSDVGAYANTWTRRLNEFLDFLTFQWVNLFISYDGGRNPQMARQLQDARQDARRGISARLWHRFQALLAARTELSWQHQALLWVSLLLSCIFVLVMGRICVEVLTKLFSWWRHRPGARTRVLDPRARFYDQLMNLLERRGHRRPVQLTPREYAELLCQQHPQWHPIRLATDTYYRIEYGGQNVDRAQLDAIRAFIDSLRRTSARRSAGDPPAATRR